MGKQHIHEVQVFLGDLGPKSVRVELYADGIDGGAPVRQEMKRVSRPDAASGISWYRSAVSAPRPPSDYTARIVPHCDGAAIPLENTNILWQR